MEAIAKTKHLRMSPRKMRRVLNLIRGMDVEEAVTMLHYMRKNAAEPLAKTIHAAFANLGSKEEGERIDMKDVYIKTAYVNSGPTLKRFRPMSMGRAGKIRKRTSHVTIVVEHY
ncbi:MAG: 50S ribosomal protein L22 [Calditrichales bacterium]|jgi:large subunit ribosomal protein L22|nr:50S ribosomal protein L22 [Calditrichales bacterium]